MFTARWIGMMRKSVEDETKTAALERHGCQG